MAVMPDSALISRFQTCLTPRPSGQTMPMPVTTTRRMVASLSRVPVAGLLILLLDVIDGVLHGGDLLRRILGDFDVERLLERHHEFDRVQTVGAQVVDEGRFRGDLGFVNAEMLNDDLLDLVGDIAHRTVLSLLGLSGAPATKRVAASRVRLARFGATANRRDGQAPRPGGAGALPRTPPWGSAPWNPARGSGPWT